MPKRIIGVDYKGSTVRTVEILQSFRGAKVVAATTSDKPEINKNNGNNGQTTILISSFPQETVINRLAHFPFSGAKKIEQATPFELESWAPFEVNQFITDYQLVAKEKGASTVLIAGAKKEKISQLISEWGQIGLNPNFAIPEGFAYRNLARAIGADSKTALVFLNIEENSTVMSLTKGDQAIGARSLPFGLNDLLNKVGGEKTVKQAFKTLKVTHEILDSTYGKLAGEISNTVRYFASEEKIEASKLILCGDCAEIQGLPEWFTEKTGIETTAWSSPPQFEYDLGPEYAPALALALDQTHPVKGVNFMKDEFVHRAKTTEIGIKVIAPVLLAAGVLILWLISVLFQNRVLQSQAATLDAKIATVAAGVLGDNKVAPQDALKKLNQELDDINKMEEIIGKTDYLTPLQALTAISSRIPANVDVDIEEIIVNQEMVSITGIISDYSQMDVITNALKSFDAFKKFDPPNLKEKIGKKGGVQFTQKIFLTEEGEGKTAK